MARGKKAKKELTPEEKLERALVPEEEWPYEIPGNWCWVRWGNCGEFVAGNGFKNQYQGFTEYEIPFYKVGSLKYSDSDGYLYDGSNTISEEIRTILKATLIPPNSILFAKIGEAIRLNRRSLNAVSCCIDNNMMAFIPHACIYKYAFYWSKGITLYDYTNATTVPAIRKSDLERIAFPLPPLAEQQRIVWRIERVFSKLEEAREKIQAILDGFELRKSAILHKAFTGELTKQWRQMHGVEKESWKRYIIDNVCKEIKVGIVIKPAQYYTDKKRGTPAFRSANVREYRIDDLDWVYLNEKGMTDNKRSIVHTGDVLVVRSGNPGTACVVPQRFDGYNAIDILIAVPNQEIVLPDFLCLFTNSPLGKKFVAENKRGMALAHFNVKGYSKIEIHVPSISEQKEIICILDKLLYQGQQAKKIAETVIDQIDVIKKVVLTHAFRGMMNTNDATEECAVELLKRIL